MQSDLGQVRQVSPRRLTARVLLSASNAIGWAFGRLCMVLDRASVAVDERVPCPGCGALIPSIEADVEGACEGCLQAEEHGPPTEANATAATDPRVNVVVRHPRGAPAKSN